MKHTTDQVKENVTLILTQGVACLVSEPLKFTEPLPTKLFSGSKINGYPMVLM